VIVAGSSQEPGLPRSTWNVVSVLTGERGSRRWCRTSSTKCGRACHLDVGGSVAQWVEELAGAVLEHGAAGFIYFPVNDGTTTDSPLGRWGKEIVPAVREAIRRD
jgi:hypothetical protein